MDFLYCNFMEKENTSCLPYFLWLDRTSLEPSFFTKKKSSVKSYFIYLGKTSERKRIGIARKSEMHPGSGG